MESAEKEFLQLRHDSDTRLQTFYDHWPSNKNFLDKGEFVRQGFYCVGKGDTVRCVYCRGYLSEWDYNDDILLEHKKHFSKCPFVLSPYKYPEFRDIKGRIDSYDDWPTQCTQKVEELAQAGMFYLGKGDQTKCFWCNGVLADWQKGDIPVLEHKKWFSHCPWLEVIKNEQFFIDAVKKGKTAPQTQKSASETQSPEEELKQMGFHEDVIKKATKICGKSFNTESLVKAILELEETKTEDISPSNSQSAVDMKCLKNPTSFDPSCKICFESDFNTVFLPCGHLMSCENCAKSIKTCPMCRTTITMAKKVFL